MRIGGLWPGDLEPGRHAILNKLEIGMLPGTAQPEPPAPPQKRRNKPCA